MSLQCSKHGTTISLRRVISQCLFETPGFSKPYNDPSNLLPQSPSLFIVTGNYTTDRLHHLIGSVYNWQEDALRMFWEQHPHLGNNLLWSLLFLSKNRTASVNCVPKLGTKQPRALVHENRNHHRGEHSNPELTPAFLYPGKETQMASFFLCQKSRLKVALSAPTGWHKKWVSEKPAATQHTGRGSQQTMAAESDWAQISASFPTDKCLSLSRLYNLSLP